VKFSSPVNMKQGGIAWFKVRPVNPGDEALFRKIIATGRDGDETVYEARFELAERKRSFDQLKAAWALIDAIFRSDSEGHRRGTAEELYDLYLALLDAYAMKTPSRITGNLRPVHISKDDPECTTETAAYFIEGLMLHLATMCQLPDTTQTEVRGILTQWIAWRGGLEEDPLDDVDEATWRERHPYSEASGVKGEVVRAHLVSRGADKPDIEAGWNWVALLDEEHRLQHSAGWEAFLAKYPHLRGRHERARRKAGKLGIEIEED